MRYSIRACHYMSTTTHATNRMTTPTLVEQRLILYGLYPLFVAVPWVFMALKWYQDETPALYARTARWKRRCAYCIVGGFLIWCALVYSLPTRCLFFKSPNFCYQWIAMLILVLVECFISMWLAIFTVSPTIRVAEE